MKSNVQVAIILLAAIPVFAGSPLERHYKEGEKLTYRMHGLNNNWKYEIQANGVVTESGGKYVEEYAWTGMTGVDLNPSSLAFRQKLSLSPDFTLTVPDLSKVQPQMIGPITDLLTFYADMQVARHGALTKPGDHYYFKHGTPNSWADGAYYVLGQDSIDFDVTLTKIDNETHTAELVVRHVPPAKPEVKLPAEWMQKPVADTPNNWVEVAKQNDKYIAEVGQETFEVKIVLDLTDGKILSASLQNPVEVLKRECADAELTKCGEGARSRTFRKVEIELVR
jgi:hypothetical protein